jgi:hypothetical protein
MVAPGADRVEVCEESGGKTRGEGFAVELDGELGRKVLGHDEGDEERVAWRPGSGSVVEDVELNGEGIGMRAGSVVSGLSVMARLAIMGINEGVDAAGIGLELMKLIGGENGDSAVGSGAELEDALLAIMLNKRRAKDLGELTGAVTTKGIHLEEPVRSSDEALGEEQIVKVGSVDRGNALGIASDGNRRGEARDGDVAVKQAFVLWERRAHRVAKSDSRGDDEDDDKQREDPNGDKDALEQDAATLRGR